MLFEGLECAQPREVPTCIGSAFDGPLSLYHDAFPLTNEDAKKHGITSEDVRKQLPEGDFMGKDWQVGTPPRSAHELPLVQHTS